MYVVYWSKNYLLWKGNKSFLVHYITKIWSKHFNRYYKIGIKLSQSINNFINLHFCKCLICVFGLWKIHNRLFLGLIYYFTCFFHIISYSFIIIEKSTLSTTCYLIRGKYSVKVKSFIDELICSLIMCNLII